jgi:hypothetical protein
MALPAHSEPWPLIQFRNHFSQTVGLLGRVISPSQGLYLITGQYKHRIDGHKHPSLKWDSNPRSHVRAGEDCSCLRPRGHCDRPRDHSLLINVQVSIGYSKMLTRAIATRKCSRENSLLINVQVSIRYSKMLTRARATRKCSSKHLLLINVHVSIRYS